MEIVQFIKDYGPTFGVTGALVVYGLGRYSASKDRKRNYRSYLKTESMNANYNLKNALPKDGSKLIITENYEPIRQKIRDLKLDKDDKFVKGTYLGYMQFKNLGPGLIIEADVELHMSSTNRSWTTKTTLPIMDKDEEIYVSTDNLEALNEYYVVDEITVIYKTQQNETIKYVYKNVQDEKDLEMQNITESYYLKQPFTNIFRKLHHSKIRKTEWVYLKND